MEGCSDTCDYLFKAKHRDSKEVEGPGLEVGARKSRRALYEERLIEAVERLKNVGFGRAEEKFDAEDWFIDWERGRSPLDPGGPVVKMGILSLKPGRGFADAILRIFENSEKWSFDCFQFFQVCNLYALLNPDDKDEFERGIKQVLSSEAVTEKESRAIRTFATQVQVPFESTGLGLKTAYYRSGPDRMWNAAPSGASIKLDIDSLLAQAPIGSRVAWTNKASEEEMGFRVQNAIKVRRNGYWVHGLFGDNPHVATREEIELRHARYTDRKANAAYIKANVFISDFAIFQTPEK